jgi:hypothetical protein
MTDERILEITIRAEGMDDTVTHIPVGDYLLLCHEPCHRASIQVHGMAGETHVITVHRGSLCSCKEAPPR